MPFYYHITIVLIFSHVLLSVDPVNKNNYRRQYSKIKKYGRAAGLTGVRVTEGTQQVKDRISSKLKVYGYKPLFAVVFSPVIQLVSFPFYVFKYGSKFRRFALLLLIT